MDASAEPCALGHRVVDTREATRDLWGDDAVATVMARLGPEERAIFERGAHVPTWVPERVYVAWMREVWAGPCAGDAKDLARWANHVTDRGFGFARRMLMSLASPWLILRRAGDLWRGEHTHGTLAATPLGGTSARFVLSDHPFAEHDFTRLAVSESFRYIIERCHTKWTTQTHERAEDGSLRVLIRWG
jgi:hypothetical protein